MGDLNAKFGNNKTGNERMMRNTAVATSTTMANA
jgi:hypothetical protein